MFVWNRFWLVFNFKLAAFHLAALSAHDRDTSESMFEMLVKIFTLCAPTGKQNTSVYHLMELEVWQGESAVSSLTLAMPFLRTSSSFVSGVERISLISCFRMSWTVMWKRNFHRLDCFHISPVPAENAIKKYESHLPSNRESLALVRQSYEAVQIETSWITPAYPGKEFCDCASRLEVDLPLGHGFF